jgi:hypothetical protein
MVGRSGRMRGKTGNGSDQHNVAALARHTVIHLYKLK